MPGVLRCGLKPVFTYSCALAAHIHTHKRRTAFILLVLSLYNCCYFIVVGKFADTCLLSSHDNSRQTTSSAFPTNQAVPPAIGLDYFVVVSKLTVKSPLT
ncbi:unnamed protein product [Ceratitis capitata]|uniref:(Mediterranean fruit fly) hypothetical protein n=1 Tax=Ceratitis capitata TaxID=7213 RepID=A0A811UX91_CERCA|nr:unnamed protein product [Ceratitis capitata]